MRGTARRILRYGNPLPEAVAAWTPAALDPFAWYDAADSASLRNASAATAGNGEAVQQWNDLSGNGRHFLQATGANRPTLATSPDRRVQFDSAGPTWMETDVFTLSQPVYIVIVGKRNSAAQVIFIEGGGLAVYTESNLWGYFAGTARTGGTPDTNRHRITAQFNGASSSLNIDGTDIVTTNPGTGGATKFRIGLNAAGTGYALTGDLCEIVALAAIPSAENILLLNSYLDTKWGTGV